MRIELNNESELEEYSGTTQLLSNDRIKSVIIELFSQHPYECSNVLNDGMQFEVHYINSVTKESHIVNVFYGNIRNESRNDREKKIQLNGKDPRTIENSIILGCYCYDTNDTLDDLVFVAWNIDENTNYPTNPSLRGLSVDALQKARFFGFYKHHYRNNNVCAFLGKFIFYYLENKNSVHQPIKNVATITDIHKSNLATNKIYFGAPGTGKSYTIKQETDGLGERVRRVTFHPDYDYASFVGGYMPITEKENGTDVIKYKFAPQIFSQIYSDAWLDEENGDYYLIIEEINRGNCAEIFGDIFQILDRKTQYPISATKEMVAFLNSESSSKGIDRHTGLGDGDTLSLPTNLHIWATMNTSDQSLYPMDSAFKRRWDWVYMPICYNKTYEDKFDDNGQPLKNDSYDFKIRINDSHYPWIKFIEKVNTIISTNKSLGMDKCIGNYFIEPSKDGYIELNDFIHKVIFYLWDDVFKDETESIFDENESYESFFPIHTIGADKIIKL